MIFVIRKRDIVVGDLTVQHPDDTRGIPVSKACIVRNHDNQPVLRYILQYIHHLDTGGGIESAGGLICKDNIRVVDQGAGNGHTLHLSSGQLIGPFVQLIAQADIIENLCGAVPSLFPGHPGQRQCQFHILQNRLMRDQIIVLEYKTDGFISIGVPLPVGKVPGGFSVDDQIALGILIEATNNIQHGCFSAAGWSENTNKFIFAEF